eukprot:7695968-Ditylum_brightwellii.AAC.1
MLALWHTQISPEMLAIKQEDEEGTLVAPTSTSLLFWMLVIIMGCLDASNQVLMTNPKKNTLMVPIQGLPSADPQLVMNKEM